MFSLFFVDPVSLHIAGILNRRPSVLDRVHDLHSSLLAGSVGMLIVGWIGVAMFLLGLTGLAIRFMWARNFFRAFSFKKRAAGFAFFRDLHALAGMAAFLFFAVVALTGINIAFPAVDNAMTTIFAPQDFSVRHAAAHFSPNLHVEILHWAKKPETAGEKRMASLGGFHSREIGGYPLRIAVFLLGSIAYVLDLPGPSHVADQAQNPIAAVEGCQ